MRCEIAHPLAATAAGARAEAVLRACVHCGMCNAACPTFRLTGDELDGPRGRIYLMKQALEGRPSGALTRHHLDRCLACRACESACPSGVEYHRLLDVGRPLASEKAPRSWPGRAARRTVRWLALHPRALARLFAAGRALRIALPRALADKVPPKAAIRAGPAARHARRVLTLSGCVQAAAAPQFNAALARVFDRAGVALEETAGCCGALSAHLEAPDEARGLARQLIDAWTPALDSGAEAVTTSASGCAAFIRDWPDLLADDPDYAPRAARIAAALRDPVELLTGADVETVRRARGPVAVHDPCTLRNGPGLAGKVAARLEELGCQTTMVAGDGQCCGSAGAYSLFQPDFARRLRDEKLAALTASGPAEIVTANIGCWMHLAATSPVPVRHWIELVDELISGP